MKNGKRRLNKFGYSDRLGNSVSPYRFQGTENVENPRRALVVVMEISSRGLIGPKQLG